MSPPPLHNKNTASSSSLLPAVGTALTYAAVGCLAVLLLAIPPGYAAPLYPSAGIALACVLVWGPRVLAGVFAGSFAVNLLLGAQRGPLDAPAIALVATIATGAALQAAIGAALVRRFVGQPLTLSEPRDVARFFALGAALACTVSATIASLALWQRGALPAASLPYHWWTWWAGDALGTLIGAPAALTLIGRPRREWAFRRPTVGLPLVIVTALMAAAIHQVSHWDEQRARAIFERDAASAADRLSGQLGDVMYALEAVRGTYIASEQVSRDEFRIASAHWLAEPIHLQAIGWAERVPRRTIAAFDAAARAEGLHDFRVFDRSGPGAVATGGDTEVVAVRHIEPLDRNAAALGVNTLSVAAARDAVLRTRRSGEPAATAGFRLTQETGDQTGIVVYRAVYRGNPTTDAERDAALQGVVFTTLRMEAAVRGVMASLPAYLRWCVTDTDPAAPRRHLAGAPGCETAGDAMLAYRRTLALGGRQWQLDLSAPPGAVPEVRHWNAGLFSFVGLLATAMLGALLLTVTGRTRRIEVAVAERTADLQREVGERTRTETALRESEQRFRNILDHVPIGVIYTDLAGKIREANPRLRQMVGYTGDELARMTSTDLTHPEDRATEVEVAARLLQGEIPMFRRHKRYVAKDGRTVWALAVTTVLRDAAGRPLRLVGVVEDVTEHLLLEEAERARERAEASNRAKSEFLSRMSHELRTPLNAMLGFAQLLDLDRQPALAPHQAEWTAQIQQAGWHLLHMINDTLDLSRIEAGTVRLAIEPVDLHDVIQSTRALLDQSATQRRIAITEALDPQATTVLGDQTRIKQVLTNLLSNALKYNVEGGTVHVDSRLQDAQTVRIEVTDTGLGMTADQVAELFQPFNRLGREASATEGTGIGLVISQRLAELMGGSLGARSTAGRGSTFVLTLPCAKPGSGQRALEHDEDPLAPTYRQRVVHYIEDNETNAEVMRGILAQRPQIKLDVSYTGLDGLAAIRQHAPSMILLDMHLPDIDGLELLRHLKHHDDTAEIPVVVVSADATTARIDEALRVGAVSYLTKPVNVGQILAVLDQLLERLDTRFG